jgi:hypothetical protein
MTPIRTWLILIYAAHPHPLIRVPCPLCDAQPRSRGMDSTRSPSLAPMPPRSRDVRSTSAAPARVDPARGSQDGLHRRAAPARGSCSVALSSALASSSTMTSSICPSNKGTLRWKRMLQAHVSSVSAVSEVRCKGFVWMLQNRDVAYVVMVVHLCCKCLFPMFHLFFPDACGKCVYLDVAYVSPICCKCSI